jgi:hypothetical protein
MNVQLIPFQPPLPPVVSTIEGNVDYRLFRDQLDFIDQQLSTSGLENQFLQTDLQAWTKNQKDPSAKALHNRQLHSRRALRCNIARMLLNEDFRGFATRLPDSLLLQRFCGLSTLEEFKAPAKSTLQRYAFWWPEATVRQLVYDLIQTGAQQPEKLHLEVALDLDLYFVDTTCLAANIHYPVDWVLLRDATGTLMSAVKLIRQQGLKQRMEPPEQFITRMNLLCLEMTHARAKSDSQRQRKITFRKIDRLVGTVRGHAQRYRDLLDRDWQRTQWTRPQTEQVLRRIDQVLDLLPKARKQARQRIISGTLVDSKEKILSLYEPDARVIVRHKAGAEVEFGNTLLVGESQQGVILDWKLFEESAPADAKLLLASLDRVKSALGQAPKAVATDRGFDSESNRNGLAKRGIYEGLCPREPQRLKQRNGSWKFRSLQKRRGQTEGRIAILKNNFLGQPLRTKGFAGRNLSVTWAVLTHNLWVIARLRQKELAQAATKTKAA